VLRVEGSNSKGELQLQKPQQIVLQFRFKENNLERQCHPSLQTNVSGTNSK